MVEIYHNPRCSKSRQTLALLEERGGDIDIVLYLQTPPSAADLQMLKKNLDADSVRSFMRTKEATYKELNLDGVDDEAVLIQAIVDNPILLERPIVVNGDKAAIGRPPEAVLEIL